MFLPFVSAAETYGAFMLMEAYLHANTVGCKERWGMTLMVSSRGGQVPTSNEVRFQLFWSGFTVEKYYHCRIFTNISNGNTLTQCKANNISTTSSRIQLSLSFCFHYSSFFSNCIRSPCSSAPLPAAAAIIQHLSTMAMRRRAAHHEEGGETLPIVRKEAKNGGHVRAYKPGSLRRAKQMAVCVKYLSYAIIVLTVILVLILRFDTKDRVRHRVVNLKNRVLGNTADYYTNYPLVQQMFGAVKEPVVDQKYVVFCTVSNMESDETYVGRGISGKSPQEALKLAQTHLPRKTNKYLYVKIDVVTAVKRYEDFDYSNELNHIPGRWFGIAFNWESDWVFNPEEVHSNALVDRELVIRWERLALYAAKSGRSEGALALPDFSDDETILDYVDLFRTESVFIDTAKPDSYNLYHGHRMYPKLTPELLNDRIKAAGAYMAHIVKDSGRQVYKYYPRSDYEPFGYNLTRHAGALYAMAVIYRQWKDSFLKQSMKLTLDYLKNTIQTCPIPNEPSKTAKCSIDYETKNKVKMSQLGVNAMTVLAIIEYVDAVQPEEKLELLGLARQIATYIHGSQKDDGSFVQKIHLNDKNGLLDVDEEFFVRYYQGEVSYALARLTTLSKKNQWPKIESSWITTAEKAASFMIQTDSEEDDADFTFDNWLMMGIGEMHRAGHELPESFVEHAVRTVSVANKWQSVEEENHEELDRVGIFYDDLSSTATATKSEGLCYIIDLLEKKGKDWKLAYDTMVLSVRYQLQTQYHPEEAMYMRNPQRILGGFHGSIVSYDMRNDYTHHGATSMVCLAQFMERKAMKSS
jgi:hypothetical protein